MFTFFPPSPPPLRRGQGWWFAVLRSSAAAIKMCHRHLIKPICVQYGFRFFGYEKSESVSSAAKHQRGLQRGKPGSPLPCFASFCRSKRKAPAASGANYAFAKGSATPLGEMKLYTGNPSVTAAPCQLPLHRGAFRAVRRRRRDETGIACIGNPSVTAAPCHLPLHKGGYGSRVAS